MRTIWITLGAGAALAGLASTGPSSVSVEQEVLLSRATPQVPMVESSLAIDPRRPTHLAAAAILVDPLKPTRPGCAFLESDDGGASWARHDVGLRNCGDPWVAIDTRGTVYLAVLADDDSGRHGLQLMQSGSDRAVWDATPVWLGINHDHETIALNPNEPDESARTYLVSTLGEHVGGFEQATIRVFESVRGQPFRVRHDLRPSTLNLNATSPLVLSDGTLIATFVDFQRDVDGFAAGGMLDHRRVWALRSGVGDPTPTPPALITEACGANRAFPTAAVDASSASSRDRLYLACVSGDGRVLVHVSSTGGRRWSDPIAISSRSATVSQAPTVAVDQRGVVGVTWRGDGRQPGCFLVYFSASSDGATFSAPAVVSTAESCPSAGTGNGWAAGRWPGGGDYMGLVGRPDGFFAVWSDSRSGVFQLYGAALRAAR